tara:strand:- start:9506 stop:9754 length:249 start_codon:yes stop_codon:yes gene_type:complete
MLKWYKGTGNKKYKVEKWIRGKKIKTIQFGDKRYQQYKDTTPLKLYSSKNHLDKKRRTSYHARHNLNYEAFSPGAFSKKYLW